MLGDRCGLSAAESMRSAAIFRNGASRTRTGDLLGAIHRLSCQIRRSKVRISREFAKRTARCQSADARRLSAITGDSGTSGDKCLNESRSVAVDRISGCRAPHRVVGTPALRQPSGRARKLDGRSLGRMSRYVTTAHQRERAAPERCCGATVSSAIAPSAITGVTSAPSATPRIAL
jgi:hypothetical protein